MEMDTISSAFRKKVGTVQAVAEQRLEPQNEQNIDKVLGVDATGYINSFEVLNGEANWTANVVFNATYLTEKGEIFSMSETTNVSGKFDDNTLSSLMEPLYKLEVVDVSIENANNSDVRVQATVEVSLDVIDNASLEALDSKDENVIVKNESANVLTKCDSGKATINIQDDFDLKQNIEQVVFKCASVCVKDVTAGTGYFTVEGDVFVKACVLLTNGEDKTYKTISEVINFKEEVDAESVTKDSMLEIAPCVKYDEVTFTVSGNGEINNILNVSVPVIIRYVALKMTDYQMPCDAYSLTHKLNLVTDTFFTSNVNKQLLKHHLEGNIEIDEMMPRINKIIMVNGGNVNLTTIKGENGKLLLQGVFTANVIYLADDDDETKNSVQVEVPFSLELDMDNIKIDDDIFVIASVGEVTCKAKKGKEIDIDADLSFAVENYSKTAQTFVKEVVLTEEIAHSPYPLAIYLAPAGSTLWDISKKLNVQEDVVISQNPNLVFPLDKPESIVYFNQR